MYADIDRRGLVSIFELSPFEKNTLIDALESFLATPELSEQQAELAGRLVSMLKQIQI